MHSSEKIVDAKVGHEDGEESKRHVEVVGEVSLRPS